MADSTAWHGHADAFNASEGLGKEVYEVAGILGDKVRRDGSVAIGDWFDVGHGTPSTVCSQAGRRESSVGRQGVQGLHPCPKAPAARYGRTLSSSASARDAMRTS